MSDTTQTPAAERKIVKRYPNRKLYDTAESRYVNLDELRDMIRGGVEVQVLDHKSGEDVTGMVLAQILYEEEKKQQKTLPADVMQRIIRFRDEGLGGLMNKLLGSVEHPLQGIRDDVEAQVKKLADRGALTRDEANRFLKEWIDLTSHNVDEWQKKVDERVVDVLDRVTGIPTLRKTLDELMRRLEMMDKRLDVVEDRMRRVSKKLEGE